MWILVFQVAIVIAQLWFILKKVRQIDNKIEHHDDKPKHEKFWGHGKKKD